MNLQLKERTFFETIRDSISDDCVYEIIDIRSIMGKIHESHTDGAAPMWFKNTFLYRLDPNFVLTEEVLKNALEQRPARPCASQESSTLGFTTPFGRHSEELYHVINGKAFYIAMRREERILPSSVVKDALAEKVEEIENRDGRKVYKKERDTLKDEIIMALLPRAFTRSSVTHAIIDMESGLVFVDCSTARKAEDLLSLLREQLGSLPLRPVNVKSSPSVMMTEWVKEGVAPNDLYILDNATLMDTGEDGGKITAKKQDLSGDEIQNHLEAGKLVERLAMAYKDEMSFVIDDRLTVKGIKFEEILMDQADDEGGEDMLAQLDAILYIMLGTFREFFPTLMEAFGGEDRPEGI